MQPHELRDAFGLNDDLPPVRVEGDSWIVPFPKAGITFEVSGIEYGRSETHCQLRVTSTIPGTPAHVHSGRFNLSSLSARGTTAKYLDARCPADWPELLEKLCLVVLDKVREGNPPVRLTDVPPRETSRFRLDPVLREGYPNGMFADGGSGKSTLAAFFALLVQGGWQYCGLTPVPGQVLVCDWELDEFTYREIGEKLCRGMGVELIPLHYQQCVAPLAEEAASIGRYAARENIDLIIVDSAGFAIGGDKQSQELTMRLFSAIRGWRKSDGSQITTLIIDHVTNDEKTRDRPFGSAYWRNSMRNLWRVQAKQEDGSKELEVGLFQTKANFGKQSPLGFVLNFDDDAIYIDRRDVRDMSLEIRKGLTARAQLKTLLAEHGGGGLTLDTIVEKTGLDRKTASTRLGELVKRGEALVLHTPGGARQWWLRSNREDAG